MAFPAITCDSRNLCTSVSLPSDRANLEEIPTKPPLYVHILIVDKQWLLCSHMCNQFCTGLMIVFVNQ